MTAGGFLFVALLIVGAFWAATAYSEAAERRDRLAHLDRPHNAKEQ